MKNYLSKIVVMSLLLPLNLTAAEDNDINTRPEFCKSPDAIYMKDDVSIQGRLANADLDVITEQGKLRVLLQRKSNTCIISKTEKQLIEQFASNNGLQVHWIYVDNNWELLPSLLSGKGDIVVAQDHSIAANTQDQVSFTYPWANASYELVQRADNSRISKAEDLSGRQVAAYKDSVVWPLLVELAETQTGMSLQEIPSTVSYKEIMARVKTAQYDLAVADSLFLDTYLPLNSDLAASYSLTPQRTMAWAVRSSADKLHKSINQYLNQQYLTHDIVSTYFDGFSAIKNRGILRLITTTNPSHYYLDKGKLYGFEYELLKRFAKKHRLRVDVVLAKSQPEMYQLLKEGKGDVIAASLPGSLLVEDERIQLSHAYHFASPVIVGRDNDDQFIDIRDLSGRRITLAQDSPYWDYLLQLQEQGADFELVKAETGINMEGTLTMVALGMYDLTVIGNHQIKNKFSKEIGLKSLFPLSEPVAHRWAVRSEDKQLANVLNEYIESIYRGANYNVLHAKYFEGQYTPKAKDYTLTRLTSLSPFDDITQTYSKKYGFDWRLIVALMFQESQFNPNAASDAGAEGLMQLIPETAEFMGVSLNDTNKPEISINAGVRYLNYLRGKFEDTLLLQDRIWFTLASYNAGYGRVKKAREMAEDMGLDKDRWFDNVELAMMAMSKPFKRDGEVVRLCRCGQTVVYVREIRTRYYNYIRLTETQQVAFNVHTNARRREEVLVN